MTEGYKYATGYPLSVWRGAQLLDKCIPGWEEQINLDRLDMADGCECVVGQLHGGYYDLDALGIGGAGAKYGFWIWGRQRWDDLTAWWRELILERRAERAA